MQRYAPKWPFGKHQGLWVLVGGLSLSGWLLVFGGSDDDWLATLLIAPAASVAALVLGFSRRKTHTFALILAVFAYLGVSWMIFEHGHDLRRSARWLLWSPLIKEGLRRQATPPNGQLKHVEFDGWGGSFLMDWDAAIVEDPSDKLALRIGADMGKINGIPCSMATVERRMGPHLYYVVIVGFDWYSC